MVMAFVGGTGGIVQRPRGGARARVCAHAGNGEAAAVAAEPILIRAARGETVERPPVWLMRQAGRYMAAFREYSEKYPFRVRSETPEIAIELSLQPWRAFQMDAVIMFSDILTPLPALGIDFEMVPGVGPRIKNPVRSSADLAGLAPSDQFAPSSSLGFVGETLQALRAEVQDRTALLGFVGAPWTLAAYSMQGQADKNLVATKRLMLEQPDFVHGFLDRITDMVADYAVYQVQQGAQAVQLFDSWAHHLSPVDYERFALPYAARVAARLRSEFGRAVPVIFFANGCGGKLESIGAALSGLVDVIQVDWSVGMKQARTQLGPEFVLQGNLDPTLLFGPSSTISAAVEACCDDAGPRHILNLGHGVLQGTPEQAVGVFCDTARRYRYEAVKERV